MKRVRVKELRDGDVIIWDERYWEVVRARFRRLEYRGEFDSVLCAKIKCFMSHTSPAGIGTVRYLSMYTEVLLCEKEQLR